MSKRQTRRSVSLSASMFARLASHAHDTGKPLSQIVETWIEENTSGKVAVEPCVVARPILRPDGLLGVTAGVARNPRGRNPDDVSPAKINGDQARLALAKQAAKKREAMQHVGTLKAELPSRAKVAQVEPPKPAVILPRRGVPGAF